MIQQRIFLKYTKIKLMKMDGWQSKKKTLNSFLLICKEGNYACKENMILEIKAIQMKILLIWLKQLKQDNKIKFKEFGYIIIKLQKQG